MDKLFKKASTSIDENVQGRFERYSLSENPFPSNPYVNKDSMEKKFNGSIYEDAIRQDEFSKFKSNFLQCSQSDPNHLRLGFVIDSSYIGRGNGKSAFLVNLSRKINSNFALDLSNNINKCFAVYFAPEGGGKTKTFEKFVDIFFEALFSSNIINTCLAILRYEALQKLDKVNIIGEIESEDDLIVKLNDEKTFRNFEDKQAMTRVIFNNEHLRSLPNEFPLYNNFHYSLKPLVTQNTFLGYFKELRKEKDKYEYVFTQLISLFIAAGFGGSYVFVDDFERIPEFQSSIQRKDFATQLRTVQYDGNYLNSKVGFYNFVFALHAGVPRLMQEAWETAGLEQRVPINSNFVPRHNIMFEKINEGHARLLIKKYLSEFRQKERFKENELYPFTTEVIDEIARTSELNASRILQIANNLIEFAADRDLSIINYDSLQLFKRNTSGNPLEEGKSKDISTTSTIDLISKSQNDG